jgi:uncharacterized protein YodC (DUF2158 family)
MANQTSLKAGDVVELKSGGPKMTIKHVGDNYGVIEAYCQWFDGTKLLEGSFPPESLKKSEE